MEANGGGQGPEKEDYEIAMLVSADGMVAWVSAQVAAHDDVSDAVDAATRQKAWVHAEDAARTGWIPPPGMLIMEDNEGEAVAIRYGWILHADVPVGDKVVRVYAAESRNGMNPMATVKALHLASLRFPAQEVARGRAVCRLWSAYAASANYHRSHRDNRLGMPMLLFFFLHPDLVGFDLRTVDIRGRMSRPVLRFTRQPHSNAKLRIRGSCAGILLLSFGGDLYACNPCTRRWAHLPPLHVCRDIIGFYPTGEEKFQVLYHHIIRFTYWIFTLGTAAPRCIGRPGPAELDLMLADGVAYSYNTPPVHVRDSLHWLPRPDHRSRDILVFGTRAETFSTIPPPSIQVGGQDVPVVGHQLFEIDYRLAMAVKSPATASVHVWVRRDELWSHRYRIPLPVGAIHPTGSVFAVAQDRNLLVCCRRALLQCDALGAVLQSYELADHFTFLADGHTIEESLLLHPTILPELPPDAPDIYPPFFQDQ